MAAYVNGVYITCGGTPHDSGGYVCDSNFIILKKGDNLEIVVDCGWNVYSRIYYIPFK